MKCVRPFIFFSFQMQKQDHLIKLSASDLAGHLNCRHLTKLDMDVINDIIPKPEGPDPYLEVLWERGNIHEKNYVERLKKSGLDVVEIEGTFIREESIAQTKKAMAQGAGVIVQGALAQGRWHGRADILRRVERKSQLGSWSYEAIDTKLARKTKGGTVLQLCLYSELLFHVQGVWPENMYVVVPWPTFEHLCYRVADYSAYFRYVKSRLEQFVLSEDKIETYPDPKGHCDVCRWKEECEKRRRKDDHLCLVAGISTAQIKELDQHQIKTVASLATEPLPLKWKPERGATTSYVRIREQARVQVEARIAKQRKFEVLALEPGLGFYCLPEPSDGDVFFDIEGDPFVGELGMEYLFGYYFKDDKGVMTQVSDWALSFEQEKKNFEAFVDFIMKRWLQYPDFHIYHYAAYEPGALKRLMGKYATREENVDRMLRAGLFVDLYHVVRHSIRASVESYSIKKLEPFYGYIRDMPLNEANLALFNLQSSLELNDLKSIGDNDKQIVQAYNRDDCVSTLYLREWLESLRIECIAQGQSIPRPEPQQGAPSENVTVWLERVNAAIKILIQDIPADPKERSPEQQALWVLANILDWHRREQKAVWWEFFRLSGLSAEELLDERKALAGLSFIRVDTSRPSAVAHQYQFPAQETEVRPGDDVRCVGGKAFGSIEDISFEQRSVEICQSRRASHVHPEAVFVHNIVISSILAHSLIDLGEWVAQNGLSGQGPYQAARDLLLRIAPRIASGQIRKQGETALEAAVRVALELKQGVFPVQGPPGAGKTYAGAHMICELVKQGKKVGITANSHKVIRNLIDSVREVANKEGLALKCVQKVKESEQSTDDLFLTEDNASLFSCLKSDYHVAGGTAWLWSRPESIDCVDVLFVDEAAQMSLANVLAVSRAGKAVVLLGDPQQLEQPIQGSHPEGTDASAFDYILEGAQTISDDKGLFLDETWRLHPDITAFTSELFYNSKLRSREGLAQQKIISSGTINGSGLVFIPVDHSGNHSASEEEAVAIKKIIISLMDSDTRWVDRNGQERPVALEDILIITPYNAQVFEIQQQLPGARVGTVDKFQGQEAPISIYSMASSSHADAPRGMNFLYSLNRLNVATSRARCLSILVACPKVFEPECKTPEQMRLANAFCRYLEMARRVEGL